MYKIIKIVVVCILVLFAFVLGSMYSNIGGETSSKDKIQIKDHAVAQTKVKSDISSIKDEKTQDVQKNTSKSIVNAVQDNQVEKINQSKETKSILDERWETFKQEARKSGYVCKEAKNNSIYYPKEVIRIQSDKIMMIEGVHTSIDDKIFTFNKYYVVPDISIINLSDRDFYCNKSLFTLGDDDGYTYRPTIFYNARGSIDGYMRTNDMKRGEIAFEVPGNQTEFILNFNTKSNDIKTVKFKILIPRN